MSDLSSGLRVALARLVMKLDAMKPEMDRVCQIAHIHGMGYRGPCWEPEMTEARNLIAQTSDERS